MDDDGERGIDSLVPFAEEVWRITLTGKASLTGDCAECGAIMMPGFVKTAEAPPDVAAAADAADRT